jgi:hypothetical protein
MVQCLLSKHRDKFLIFLNWYGGGDGVQLGPLGSAIPIGLLCQARVIMMMEKVAE